MNWQKSYQKGSGAAEGFVVLNDHGGYSALFLKPRDLRRHPKLSDWVLISVHRKLATAKYAVEKYARAHGFVLYRSARWMAAKFGW